MREKLDYNLHKRRAAALRKLSCPPCSYAKTKLESSQLRFWWVLKSDRALGWGRSHSSPGYSRNGAFGRHCTGLHAASPACEQWKRMIYWCLNTASSSQPHPTCSKLLTSSSWQRRFKGGLKSPWQGECLIEKLPLGFSLVYSCLLCSAPPATENKQCSWMPLLCPFSSTIP